MYGMAKAYRNTSKLTKKVIIDKNGHRKTVYVRIGLPTESNKLRSKETAENEKKPKSAKAIIGNLKTILQGYDVRFTSEKSRISESQYLYVNFPGGETYKFRISDHDYPTHEQTFPDETPPDNPYRENLTDSYDFRGNEYEKAKETLMGLLASHKTPKHGGTKPVWVDKISELAADYFKGAERDINMTTALQSLKKLNKLTIKPLYKYSTLSEILSLGLADGEEIPSFFQKLMKKHDII
jgi:hypothetical protein